jgi:hypothetical protein
MKERGFGQGTASNRWKTRLDKLRLKDVKTAIVEAKAGHNTHFGKLKQ